MQWVLEERKLLLWHSMSVWTRIVQMVRSCRFKRIGGGQPKPSSEEVQINEASPVNDIYCMQLVLTCLTQNGCLCWIIINLEIRNYMDPQRDQTIQAIPGSDQEDGEFSGNELELPQPRERVGSDRKAFFVFVMFVIVLLAFNYDPYRSKQASIESAKAEVQDKTLEPVFEKIEEKVEEEKEITKQISEQQMAKPIAEAQDNEKSKDQPKLPSVDEQPSKTTSDQSLIVKPAKQKPIAQPKPALDQYPISEQQYKNRIYAGEIHYSRIPVQYWQHRILMLKAMGLNSLSVYVIWNYHETKRNVFDYTTQNKNITMFLEFAIKHNMKVLLRPGPYICGEWDFGGLPARLLGIDNLKIRSGNQEYLKEVELYFKSLAPIIKPYLAINNGPIILVQIENQLGSFSSDKQYTLALVKMWNQLGIDSQFYIQDSSFAVSKNYFQGAAIGLSGGTQEFDYSILRQNTQIDNDTLIFGGEIYTGWMTHWGERWGGNHIEKFRRQVEFLFQNEREFSLYMAYGGTNFGLTAGANAEIHNLSYEPMITSYDYDATITEQGRKTNKADMIVDLMKKYVRPPSISFPKPISTISFEKIQPTYAASLLMNLGEPDLKEMAELYYFQHPKLSMYNQGIVVYEAYLSKGKYQLSLMVHDFAIIFLDGEATDVLTRYATDIFASEVQCNLTQCRLLILVEAMGHNNYGTQQQLDMKGLIYCNITIASQQNPINVKVNWNMYKVNIDQHILQMSKTSQNGTQYPAIFKATFDLKEVGDTYINMQDYQKGYLWVNGRNLGRYWNRGPQFRLYCPGVWLKQKNNKIVILQLLSETKPRETEPSIKGEHMLVDQI